MHTVSPLDWIQTIPNFTTTGTVLSDYRSLTYYKLNENSAAFDDAKKCVELNPKSLDGQEWIEILEKKLKDKKRMAGYF